MRIIVVFALGILLVSCAEPQKPKEAGPAPLPAHPVGTVSKTELPPVSGPAKSASAKDCTSPSAQGTCN